MRIFINPCYHLINTHTHQQQHHNHKLERIENEQARKNLRAKIASTEAVTYRGRKGDHKLSLFSAGKHKMHEPHKRLYGLGNSRNQLRYVFKDLFLNILFRTGIICSDLFI